MKPFVAAVLGIIIGIILATLSNERDLPVEWQYRELLPMTRATGEVVGYIKGYRIDGVVVWKLLEPYELWDVGLDEEEPK